MFPSGTSIAQRSPLCGRPVSDNRLAARWPVAEAKPERCVDLQSPSKLFSHFVSSQTFFFFFFSLSSLWKAPDVCGKPLCHGWREFSLEKELIGLIRHLDFWGGQRTTQGGVVYRATPGSSKHGGLDLLTGRIITAWHGLPWLLEHRNREGTEGKCSEFNKIWEKHVCLFG